MNKKKNLNSLFYFIVCLVFMIIFNLSATGCILNNLSTLSGKLKFIDIVYVENPGAAFSSFQHSIVLLIIVSIAAILIIMYELYRNRTKYSPLFYFFFAMLISGISCNTYERIAFGYVRDFISIKSLDFPIFNISDILINCAVFAIMYLIITKKYLKHD